jgi:hypothetical protein
LIAAKALDGVLRSEDCIPTFLWTLDMERPSIIGQTVNNMAKILLKHFQSRHESKPIHTHSTFSQTTSIAALASTVFGQAPSDSTTTHHQHLPSSAPEGHFRLILCAVLPNHSSIAKFQYMERQALRLVHYHLHRYANALHATLLFLQDTHTSVGGAGSNNHMEFDSLQSQGNTTDTFSLANVVGLTVQEVSRILKAILQDTRQTVHSLPDNKTGSMDTRLLDKDDPINNTNPTMDPLETETYENGIQVPMSPTAIWLHHHGVVDNVQLKESSIYLPESHDDEWVESVLLRNAHCPGSWDAYKDPIGVALQSISTSEQSSTDTHKDPRKNLVTLNGDQEWLSTLSRVILSDSSIPVGTTGAETVGDASTKRGRAERITPAKKNATAKGEEEDVANFFDDLLKK